MDMYTRVKRERRHVKRDMYGIPINEDSKDKTASSETESQLISSQCIHYYSSNSFKTRHVWNSDQQIEDISAASPLLRSVFTFH